MSQIGGGGTEGFIVHDHSGAAQGGTLGPAVVDTPQLKNVSVTAAKLAADATPKPSQGGVGVGTDFGTSSTTYVDVPNATVTVTLPNPSNVIIVGTWNWYSNILGTGHYTRIVEDGGAVGSPVKYETQVSNNRGAGAVGVYRAAVAAGSHTWKLQTLTQNGADAYGVENAILSVLIVP